MTTERVKPPGPPFLYWNLVFKNNAPRPKFIGSYKKCVYGAKCLEGKVLLTLKRKHKSLLSFQGLINVVFITVSNYFHNFNVGL